MFKRLIICILLFIKGIHAHDEDSQHELTHSVLTKQDELLIHQIIRIVADHNLLQLHFKKGDLKAKLEKISIPSSLFISSYIFQCPTLSSDLQKIKRNRFKWKKIMDYAKKHERKALSIQSQ
ncbi:MAG: hypothetical protein ACOVOR_05185 [Rhabdochlamydiaceae bacterium]